MYEAWDEMSFGADLSHRNPYVYAELLKLARMIEDVGRWLPL
jgi:hypothetical protein